MLKRKIISFCTLALMLSASVCNPLFIYAETTATSSYTDEQGNTVYVTDDGFEYIIENDEITITKYTGDAVDLIIPDYIEGLPVTMLGERLIQNDLTETITLSKTLKKLQPRTFFQCTALKEIYLNEGLEEIQTQNFIGCINLKKITLPSTLNRLWDSVFNFEYLEEIIVLNPYLKNIDIYKINDNYTTKITCYENTDLYTNCQNNGIPCNSLGICIPSDFSFNYIVNDDDNTATITGCNFIYATEINIPEYIDGYKVTEIGESAFRDYNYLKKITMPDTVSNIGYCAFYSCKQLEEIKLSKDITALPKKTYTSYIHFDTPVYTYEGIFQHCQNLKTIIIPDGITIVEQGTFASTYNIEKIILPNSITKIEESSLLPQNSLMIYTYPNSKIVTDFADNHSIPCKFIGDVSGNNEIDSSDALTLLNTVVGNSEKTDDMEVCDFDYDGEITSADVLILLNYIVGNIDSLY